MSVFKVIVWFSMVLNKNVLHMMTISEYTFKIIIVTHIR